MVSVRSLAALRLACPRGDGAHPSWWGVDAAGRVVQLVVDFGILVHPVTREVSAPLAGGFDLGVPGLRIAVER